MWTILSEVADRASERADDLALSVLCNGTWTNKSYAELQADISSWASFLASRVEQQGSVVFIILRHCVEMYPVFLGAMRAGLVPSFLAFPSAKQDARVYWEGHAQLFARVQPACIISYRENVDLLKERITNLQCVILDIDTINLQDLDVAMPMLMPGLADLADPDRLALLQHSSGTTGLNKGVGLTVSQIHQQFSSYAAAAALDERSCVLTWLPVYHDMGLITSFLLPLTVGSRVVSIDAFDWLRRPDMLLKLVGDVRATHCWLPNFAFNHLIRTYDRTYVYDLSSLRLLVNCSEPARPETMRLFYETFGGLGLALSALRVCYAMAEAVFAVTQSEPEESGRVLRVNRTAVSKHGKIIEVAESNRDKITFLSCGRPIENSRVHVERPVNSDVGEVYISGSFVFSGYHYNPVATSESFCGEWFRTGDIGFLHDGRLYICGRSKELIIVHGRNFYATDIEEIVGSLSGVKSGRAAAFGLFNSGSASEEAYVVAESVFNDEGQRKELEAAIKAAVFSRLELTLRAAEIVASGHVIKTTSGKISRDKNKERYIMRHSIDCPVSSIEPGFGSANDKT